jgi:four helix bundle protein
MKIMEDLDVYRLSYEVVLDIYEITKKFPKEETYGLVSQMRRAAVSIVSNLSEGGARISIGESKQFIGIARGSVAELKTQVQISKDIGYISNENNKLLVDKLERIKMMMIGLLK